MSGNASAGAPAGGVPPAGGAASDGAPPEEVRERLDAIEAQRDVRILYACESGSRAWGFASPDSDYDVRFVYVRRRDSYLSIDAASKRDVIETPIEGLWDVNGWDLAKALRLLAKSNPPLQEWLRSPIVYRDTPAVSARLRELAVAHTIPRTARLHYLNMANANHRGYLKGDIVKLKKYLYLLRPLFACRWLERDLGPVPVEFRTLLHGTDLPQDVIDSTERLLALKRQTAEIGDGPADPVLNAYIDAERTHQESLATDLPRTPRRSIEDLNAFFRATLASTQPD